MTTLRYTGHAVDEMANENVSRDEVRLVVDGGVVIREYPEDKPFPSRLMLGWPEGKPVHVVCANQTETVVVIITVYRPDPEKWDATFTMRINR